MGFYEMYIEQLKEKFEAISFIKDKTSNLIWNPYDCLYEAIDWNNNDHIADMHWVNGAWVLYQHQNDGKNQ